MFEMLLNGFVEIFSRPEILLFCLLGCLIGTLIGALPGLGPSTAIAILLPTIYGKDPLASLVMLAGIFSGAMFGGAISSVTLNIPGTGSALVTTFDGYPLAQKGMAGKALGVAAFSSFLGGTLATVLLCFLGIPLAKLALEFAHPEYFCIYLLTFVLIVGLTEGGPLKTLISLFLGFLFASVGMDPSTGTARLNFGSVSLMGGIEFLPAIIGLFGMSEVVLNLAKESGEAMVNASQKQDYRLKHVIPTWTDLKKCIPTILRQSVLGFFVGALPGAGASIASLTGYSIEKRISKDPENFGKGDIRGVAAPEAANNSCSAGSYVPLLTMGIPGSATSALLLGAFILVGIQPGPLLFTEHADVAGGLIASMYVGNVMLLIVNTSCIPFFIKMLNRFRKVLHVIVSCLCIVGTYAMRNSFFDVVMMAVFTVIGIFYKKLGIPAAPTIIALVLGYQLEFSFRQTEVLLDGNFAALFQRPICAVLLTAAVLFTAAAAVLKVVKRQNSAGSSQGQEQTQENSK